MNRTEPIYKIGGYVKRAKLNLRNGDDVRAFHRGVFEKKFGGMADGALVDVYIDITGAKEISKRPEMLRLMRDCTDCIMRAAAATDAQSERPPCPVGAATLRSRCATYLK